MNTQRNYLSVTELTSRFNTVLQQEFPSVAFKGEISQCTRASSGHVYFTVKDEKSQLSAVMWRGVSSKLHFEPKQGLEVLCEGKPSLYAGNGRFQVVVHRMEEAGEGLLQKKFLELKEKLEKEGLFDLSRKRPLPFFPEKIGIITSKTGAAIHDIMTKIRERMPSVSVLLYNARVQGKGAAEEIVAGLNYFQTVEGLDVLIVGRGGGSLEDLWSFNEEVVVRAIFASRIPVISAVGHEVDISLSDLAADYRAPTPTAAGECVVPQRDDLLSDLDRYASVLQDFDRWFYPYAQAIDDLENRLQSGFSLFCEKLRSQLEKLRGDLSQVRPDRYIASLRRRIEEEGARLREAVRGRLRQEEERVRSLERRLVKIDPVQLVRAATEKLNFLEQKLQQGTTVVVREKKQRLREYYKVLQALNIERVLKRGFSLVSAQGKFVRLAGELSPGQGVDIRFAEGRAEAQVRSVEESSVENREGKKVVSRDLGRDEDTKQTVLF